MLVIGILLSRLADMSAVQVDQCNDDDHNGNTRSRLAVNLSMGTLSTHVTPTMMAIVEDDAVCGFSHLAELSPSSHFSAPEDDEELSLEELSLDEELPPPDEDVSLPDDCELSSPGGERTTRG